MGHVSKHRDTLVLFGMFLLMKSYFIVFQNLLFLKNWYFHSTAGGERNCYIKTDRTSTRVETPRCLWE